LSIYIVLADAAVRDLDLGITSDDLGPVAPTPLTFKWDSTPDLSGTEQRTRCTNAIYARSLT